MSCAPILGDKKIETASRNSQYSEETSYLKQLPVNLITFTGVLCHKCNGKVGEGAFGGIPLKMSKVSLYVYYPSVWLIDL